MLAFCKRVKAAPAVPWNIKDNEVPKLGMIERKVFLDAGYSSENKESSDKSE